jgi:hypothetical protein
MITLIVITLIGVNFTSIIAATTFRSRRIHFGFSALATARRRFDRIRMPRRRFFRGFGRIRMPRNFFRSFGFVEVDGRRTLQFGAKHARTVNENKKDITTVNYNCKERKERYDVC